MIYEEQAMPQDVGPTTFDMDEPRLNQRFRFKLLRPAKLVRQIEFDGREYPLYLTKLNSSQVVIWLDEPLTKHVLYFVKFKIHSLKGIQGISQVAVWRNRAHGATTKLAPLVFWNYLLPYFKVMVADVMQTANGKAFWFTAMTEAKRKGYNVYVYDSITNTFNEAFEHGLIKEKEIWGSEKDWQTKLPVISLVKLKTDGNLHG